MFPVACRLSPVATDGKDGNGLKFEKIGKFFQVLIPRLQRILKKLPSLIKFIRHLRRSFTEAFCL